MEDIPWLYVAMIFIAFASWLWNQVQEAAAARKASRAERESGRNRHLDASEVPETSERRPAQRSPHAPSGQQDEGGEGPKSFRDIFRELERQLSETPSEPAEERAPPSQSPPRKQPSPPPLPDAARSVPASTKSGTSSMAAASLPPVELLEEAPPLALTKVTSRRRNRGTSDSIKRALKNQGNLRVALVLKEILDPPRSLKSVRRRPR